MAVIARQEFPSVLKELLRAAFDLNATEMDIFCAIHSRERSCVYALVSDLGLKRSSIQKALKRLMKLDIIERNPISLTEFRDLCGDLDHEAHAHATEGHHGRLYLYQTAPTADLKRRVAEKIKSWRDVLDGW